MNGERSMGDSSQFFWRGVCGGTRAFDHLTCPERRRQRIIEYSHVIIGSGSLDCTAMKPAFRGTYVNKETETPKENDMQAMKVSSEFSNRHI